MADPSPPLVLQWWPLLVALILIGMWAGRIETKLAQIDHDNQYYRGAAHAPTSP